MRKETAQNVLRGAANTQVLFCAHLPGFWCKNFAGANFHVGPRESQFCSKSILSQRTKKRERGKNLSVWQMRSFAVLSSTFCWTASNGDAWRTAHTKSTESSLQQARNEHDAARRRRANERMRCVCLPTVARPEALIEERGAGRSPHCAAHFQASRCAKCW